MLDLEPTRAEIRCGRKFRLGSYSSTGGKCEEPQASYLSIRILITVQETARDIIYVYIRAIESIATSAHFERCLFRLEGYDEERFVVPVHALPRETQRAPFCARLGKSIFLRYEKTNPFWKIKHKDWLDFQETRERFEERLKKLHLFQKNNVSSHLWTLGFHECANFKEESGNCDRREKKNEKLDEDKTNANRSVDDDEYSDRTYKSARLRTRVEEGRVSARARGHRGRGTPVEHSFTNARACEPTAPRLRVSFVYARTRATGVLINSDTLPGGARALRDRVRSFEKKTKSKKRRIKSKIDIGDTARNGFTFSCIHKSTRWNNKT